MASPSVISTSEYAETSGSATSITPTFTQTTGDMVIVLVSIAQAVTISSISDGFTLLTSGSLNYHILYKLALDGSEGGNVNFTISTGSKVCAIAYNIQGHSTSQAPEMSTIATGSSNAPDSTTVTPTGGSKSYLWLATARPNGEISDNDSIITGVPTGYSNAVAKTTGTVGVVASNCCVISAEKQSTASSEDPAAWSININVAWVAYTLAIHPAATASSKLGLLGVG